MRNVSLTPGGLYLYLPLRNNLPPVNFSPKKEEMFSPIN
jgi:hypothetical protein